MRMLMKICQVALYAIIAVLSTFVMISWWRAFGMREAYPYIMTAIAFIAWGLVYNSVKEMKED